jgi:hypothetical protein
MTRKSLVVWQQQPYNEKALPRAVAFYSNFSPVVARSNASPVLETPEHDLNPVAPFVAALSYLTVLFRDFLPGMQGVPPSLVKRHETSRHRIHGRPTAI